MSDSVPVRGVLVAHGGMARGMIDAVRRISGVGEEVLTPLSNEGRSPEMLLEDLTEILGSDPAIVFTDLASGSCALAALSCCQEGSRQVVFFGVSLPVLLDFVFHRDLPLDQLVPRLLEKGRTGLKSIPEFPADAHHTLQG